MTFHGNKFPQGLIKYYSKVKKPKQTDAAIDPQPSHGLRWGGVYLIQKG
jgi:hypothetical protein